MRHALVVTHYALDSAPELNLLMLGFVELCNAIVHY